MSPNLLRSLRVAALVSVVALVSACGFHLRHSAALPPGMKKIHLTVSGGGRLERELTRALENSDVTVVDKPAVDAAELAITSNTFRTDSLTVSGTARVTEYAVRYHVDFNAKASDGTVIIAPQSVDMSREFSYDATNTIGTASQTEELQRSLIGDMVQAILFRLQAAGAHPALAAPAQAPASSN
ncbi:LPS-assembly lipoprotein LptE [Luteibacter sp. UNCMF366Tsu5.1]|uniref:LPS-assembly lipoprotein LptE n=1 Tax=Luteibacter sp. UNCMF366Tsu5.1 TaxID=1502758 RepID=UPI0009085B6C|nr:LPS assembly lipoprotein LptE [Luteibacter sp. UNCMF366Tsu5.1]SFW60225.1 LPS-assembly lipoprotein [Luteibacter sp. UNCMF366Tsu5.1]